MTWKQFFNNPKCVLWSVVVIVAIYLAFNPQTMNHLVQAFFGPLLAMGIMVYGFKILIFGNKKPGEKKKGS